MMRTIAVVFSCILCACSSSHADGDAGADGSASRDGSVRTDGSPRDGATRTERCRSSEGEVWEGYVEAYMFESGSDRVLIAFNESGGDGPRTGCVVFGDAAPLPPVTDPEVGYPSNFDSEVGTGVTFGTPFEGFEYSIVDGLVEGDRVRLGVQLGEVWREWCSLQTPVNPDDGLCLPNTGGGRGPEGCFYNDPSGRIYVDCGKWALCAVFPICVCAAGECMAEEGNTISFDFHVVGDNGDGTIRLGGGNIHLMR